jgi:hypothetical protein
MSKIIKEWREKFYSGDMQQVYCKEHNAVVSWAEMEQFIQQSEQEIIQDYQTNFEQQHIASAIAVLRNEICEKVEKAKIVKKDKYDCDCDCVSGDGWKEGCGCAIDDFNRGLDETLKIIKSQE